MRTRTIDVLGMIAIPAEQAEILGKPIERVDTFGDFSVYHRCWQESGLRKFVVFRESDGKALEEFRTLGSAVTWAQRMRREQH